MQEPAGGALAVVGILAPRSTSHWV